MAKTSEKTAPTVAPPMAAAATADAGERPSMSPEAAAAQTTRAAEGPEMAPPSAQAAAAAGEQAIGAWFNSVHITALWCNASARNAWAAVEGQGWRRVSAANDSEFVTLTALLSHVKQMNSLCNVRIESDNLIHEVYAW
jgi:hypothetical protein